MRNTITEDKGHKHVRKRRQDYSGRTDLTHRVGALLPMPPCLGRGHTGGSGQRHPRCSSAHRVGRPWVAHNKQHATPPTRQNQDYRDTPWLPTCLVFLFFLFSSFFFALFHLFFLFFFPLFFLPFVLLLKVFLFFSIFLPLSSSLFHCFSLFFLFLFSCFLFSFFVFCFFPLSLIYFSLLFCFPTLHFLISLFSLFSHHLPHFLFSLVFLIFSSLFSTLSFFTPILPLPPFFSFFIPLFPPSFLLLVFPLRFPPSSHHRPRRDRSCKHSQRGLLEPEKNMSRAVGRDADTRYGHAGSWPCTDVSEPQYTGVIKIADQHPKFPPQIKA